MRAGSVIRALDGTIERLAHRLAAVVFRRRPWTLLTAAVVFVVVGGALLSSLGRHLGAMHLPGAGAMGLDQLAGPAHLDAVTRTWRQWFAANDDAGFRSPHALAGLWLTIDTFLLVPGYTVGALFVLLREHEHTPVRRPALLPTLRWTAMLAIVLAVADVVENGLSWYLIDQYWTLPRSQPGLLDNLLAGVASLKWLAGIGVAVPVLVVLFSGLRSMEGPTRAGMRVLRAHLFVAALGVAAFLAPIQLPDLIVRWDAAQAATTVGTALVAAVAVWATGGLALELHARHYGTLGRFRAGRWWRFAAVALLLTLVRVAFVNQLAGGDPMAPLIPVMAVVAVFLAGVPLRAGGATSHRVPGGDVSVTAWAVPRVLAAALIGVGGLAALQAWTALYVQRDDPWLVLTIGVGLVAGAFVMLVLLRRIDRRLAGRGYAAWAIAATLLAASAVGVFVIAATTAPTTAGAVAVAYAFFGGAVVVLTALVLIGAGWAATQGVPPALHVVGLRRGVPVLAFLLVWGIVAAALDDASHWNVRTLQSGGAEGVTVESAFSEWLTAAEARAAETGAAEIPMVIVATSGGGIRSAYWTALALDCIFLGAAPPHATGRRACTDAGGPQQAEPADVFFATGISGGSLGLVEWDARLEAGGDDDWVEERLGADFLAPSLARGLLVEVPRSWLHFDAANRGDVIEEAWERGWGAPGAGNPLSAPFLARQSSRDRQGRPLLMLNGASVFDGCALNVSVLQAGATDDQKRRPRHGIPPGDCVAVEHYLTENTDAGPLPATVDILDYLRCRDHRDVRRSTAALLSARFPYVSPAGRLAACGRGASTKFIVDGGYVDTSAAESATALWQAIEPLVDDYNRTSPARCVVPFFLQLDNSYLATTSPPDRENPPNQLVAPAIALWQTTGLASRAERARASAAQLFAPDNYALLTPRNHPGAKAPLGWTLADASRRDLERELFAGNGTAIRRIRGFLANPPPCPET